MEINSIFSQKFYCAWATVPTDRNNGSSGGVFEVVAQKFILEGGIVAGAAWTAGFDGVEHILVDNLDDLAKTYKSKYVESTINEDFWEKLRGYLENGQKVLFSGTPCQVAICKAKNMEFADNLFTIDVLCHGAPDPDVWRAYKSVLTYGNRISLKEINQRKKDEYGWTQRKVQYVYNNWTATLTDRSSDAFCKLFLNDVILNERCYNCAYAKLERISDITLGDFWSLKNDNRFPDRQKGLSLVVVNSSKGEFLFSKVKDKLAYAIVSRDEVLKDNIPLLRPPIKSKYRESFYQNLKMWGFVWANKRFNKYQSDVEQRLYNFNIFRNLAILQASNVNINNVLSSLGIDVYYVYGYGDVGKCFLNVVDHRKIKGIIDKKFMNSVSIESGLLTYNSSAIPDDGLPIIVTSGFIFQEIQYELKKSGIDIKRLISFAEILRAALETAKGKAIEKVFNNGKALPSFLVTGAQFGNKGAEAMLYTTMSEIRNSFVDARIYFLPCILENYSEEFKSNYKLDFMDYRISLDNRLFDIVPRLSAIVDVSGYALKSDQGIQNYLQILRIAKNYEIPLYLMPQSYGPLDFDQVTDSALKEVFPNVKIIYAREEFGKKQLEEKYNLKNVVLSNDLVLQSNEIVWTNIYKSQIVDTNFDIPNEAVAIIPNIRNIEYGEEKNLLDIYEAVITQLLDWGKRVYIVPHSDDDVAYCRELTTRYKQTEMPWENLDCRLFQKIVSKFDYVVASRYHSIVHAYKAKVPCIIIGWADKYREIANLMKQDVYCFDVREHIEIEKIKSALLNMENNKYNNRRVIDQQLNVVQDINCFSFLKELKEDLDETI